MIRAGLWVIPALSLLLSSCKMRKTATPELREVPESVREIYFDAESAFLNGNTTEAGQLFADYVKKSPAPAPGYYRLACLSANSGKTDDALIWVGKAIQADSSNPYYKIYEADLYQRKRDYLNAGISYEKLALRYPSRWSFFTDAARMYKYAGTYDRVLQLCAPWEKAFGLREDIAVAKSEACMQLKRYEEGFSTWTRLMDRYPYRKNYRLTYAGMLSKAGWTDSAAKVFEMLLSEDPENPDLLASLCSYYQTNGNTARLWQHCQLVVRSPQMDLWKKHSCLVPFLNDLNDNRYYDSLEAPLKTLTVLHPQDHRSWLFLSDWYFARRQYLSAIDGFSRTLSLFAGDFRIWSKYTECLDRSAAYSRLVLVADSMAEMFPSNPTVELIAANAAEGTSNWAKAEEHCTNGLVYAVDEDIIVALKLSLARVLNASGKQGESENIFKDLRKNYPLNTEVMNGYARWKGLDQKLFNEALALADEAISITPKAEYFFTRAGIYLKMSGHISEAIKDIEKAISLDRQGKYLVLYGDILLASGKTTEAIQQWKSAWNEGYHSPDLQQKLSKTTP